MSISERDVYLERLIIEHCSPTLAALKTGNLFTVSYDSDEQLHEVVSRWNRRFFGKNVTLSILRSGGGKALLYIYRESRLQSDLRKRGVARFLAECGYESTDADYCVRVLSRRICESGSFPHEIGLFLSYPLGDVMGFIANGGRNSKLDGYWKVYCNAEEAEKLFAKYSKCRSVYSRLWQNGRSVRQLTVG